MVHQNIICGRNRWSKKHQGRQCIWHPGAWGLWQFPQPHHAASWSACGPGMAHGAVVQPLPVRSLEQKLFDTPVVWRKLPVYEQLHTVFESIECFCFCSLEAHVQKPCFPCTGEVCLWLRVIVKSNKHPGKGTHKKRTFQWVQQSCLDDTAQSAQRFIDFLGEYNFNGAMPLVSVSGAFQDLDFMEESGSHSISVQRAGCVNPMAWCLVKQPPTILYIYIYIWYQHML